MAATKRNAASKAASSSEPDMEDLFAKHPGVRSAIERAPEARQALLEWYDANHRVLPWRRNAHSRHCEPTDASDGTNANDDPKADAADSSKKIAYWRLDLCGSVGAARDVPRDQYAYGVWVSEIMSQQTQIERVAVYWLRWMAKWPTVHALANATQEEVNELWAGLGYYRRARFLLEGARHVVAKNDGFPSTFKALAGVPGVGPYTAAAVASIAFEEPVAAVDGNVIRVAARLAAARGGGDPAKAGTSAAAAVRAVANAMLARERPGDFNQAMMELGATVCAPRNPKCSACPVAAHCVGLELQTASVSNDAIDATFNVENVPEKEKKAPKREESVAVRFVEARVSTRRARRAEGDGESDSPESDANEFTETGDRPNEEEEEHVGYLLTKREEGGLLGGLWEFPSARMETPNDGASDAQTRIASRAFENLPFDGAIVENASDSGVYVGAVTHVFSHVRQTMHVTKSTVRVVLPRKSDPADFFKSTSASRRGASVDDGPEWRWVRAGDVKDAGLSSGVVKVHALVTKPPGGDFKKNPKKPKKPNSKNSKNSNSSEDAKPKPGESAVEKMFAAARKRAKTEP
jgi:A/G-specific adenine glycosylase